MLLASYIIDVSWGKGKHQGHREHQYFNLQSIRRYKNSRRLTRTSLTMTSGLHSGTLNFRGDIPMFKSQYNC